MLIGVFAKPVDGKTVVIDPSAATITARPCTIEATPAGVEALMMSIGTALEKSLRNRRVRVGVPPDPVRVMKRLAPFGLEVLGANARASGEALRLVIGTLGRV